MKCVRFSALLSACATVLAFTFCSVAPAQQNSTAQGRARVLQLPLAGAHRPGNVPENYVVTPFGYFHPSCVFTLRQGESQLADGRIMHKDGSVDAAAPSCDYARFDRKGNVVEARETQTAAQSAAKTSGTTPPPYISHDYIGTVYTLDDVYIQNSWSYTSLSSVWQIPPAPKTDDGQTIYLFPGFETLSQNIESILQPVLGWNAGQWFLSSWNCCMKNTTVVSNLIPANAGDRIYGSITSNCTTGFKICPTWNVVTADLDSGLATVLGNTPAAGQAFNWAMIANLEVYSIYTCDNYPQGGQLTFEDIRLYDLNGNLISRPPYYYQGDPTDQPQCNYGWNSKYGNVTLTY
jgi:hypothetical protein